ncbi:MAG: FHA domain-containing protein [bacterium]|nr:FHA domain-containing protein [bacterium]
MQCPNCQHWNEIGSRFCEECGIELPKQDEDAAQVSVTVSDGGTAPPPLPPADASPGIPITPPDLSGYSGPHLVLKSTGSIFKLGSSAVMGRENPNAQIDFDGYPDGKYISHRHAQIVKINERYYIEDLGSSNSTFVNDIKLAQGQAEPISHGDVIRLGKVELTFQEPQGGNP